MERRIVISPHRRHRFPEAIDARGLEDVDRAIVTAKQPSSHVTHDRAVAELIDQVVVFSRSGTIPHSGQRSGVARRS
jgi:hypothetical protein